MSVFDWLGELFKKLDEILYTCFWPNTFRVCILYLKNILYSTQYHRGGYKKFRVKKTWIFE